MTLDGLYNNEISVVMCMLHETAIKARESQTFDAGPLKLIILTQMIRKTSRHWGFPCLGWKFDFGNASLNAYRAMNFESDFGSARLTLHLSRPKLCGSAKVVALCSQSAKRKSFHQKRLSLLSSVRLSPQKRFVAWIGVMFSWMKT